MMKEYLGILMACFFNLSVILAQDGYWNHPSEFPPNSFAGNATFNFDYVITGQLQARSLNATYNFSIHINSQDGTWLVDEPVALINGYNPERDNRQFRFHMFYPNGNNRQYFYVTDAEAGENPYQYIGARNISGGTQVQWSIVQGQIFEEFRNNARKTNAPNHRRYGPQTKYTGQINGERIVMHISNRHAPINITPEIIGFMIGVFQDDLQRQNRYITYYESQYFTVALNTLQPENYTVDATAYDGAEIETYNPAFESEQESANRESVVEEISNSLNRVYEQLQNTTDNEQIMTLTFTGQLLAFNLQKASLNQMDQVIPEATINQLVDQMSNYYSRYATCEQMPDEPHRAKQACLDNANSILQRLTQRLQSLGFQGL